MTSFPDEQPLSRRARRERLREQQAQNDVPRVDPADTDDAASGNDAASAEERTESAAATTPATPEAVDESQSAPDAGSDGDRPLTRRERREKMLREAQARSQPVAARPLEEEPAETAEASDAAPAARATTTVHPAEPTKNTSTAVQSRPVAAEKTAPEPLRPASVPDAGERTLSDVIGAQRDVDGEPKLSPAFGAGLRTDQPRESAPPSFEKIIAPEARSSDALTTSNVLILPTGPQHQFPAPVRTTGEIIVTGSVDLPTGGAENETHASVDRTDIDSGLDQNGNVPATAGTPVAATKAVSTHTATRDVITPPTKSANSRLLMILAITAGVLCVAVIGVVIVGLMTGAL